jgi:anti-anti-sigma factor
MEIKIQRNTNEHCLLRITGDVLMENSKDFYSGVKESFEGKLHFLSLDFSKVQFIDSSGIGALIKLTSELKKEGCVVNVIGLNKNLTAVFQLSGISSIIKIRSQPDFCAEFPDFQASF